MATANMAIRFVVELVGVGALAFWGSQATDGLGRVALAIAAPLALVAFWAMVVAPKAANTLAQPERDVIGTLVLVGAAVALAAAGQPTAALVFGGVVVLNWVLILVLGRGELGQLS